MIFRKKYIKKKNKFICRDHGFTLIETLVAIAIFSVGTAAAVNVVFSSVKLAPKIENRTIASHLAQEGIEIVKNIRDMNWVNGSSFNIGLAQGWGCVEYGSNSLDYNCSLNGGSDVIYFDGSYYSHNSTASKTDFSRKVTISNISASEIKVVSEVACGANCSVSLEDHLFDWR